MTESALLPTGTVDVAVPFPLPRSLHYAIEPEVAGQLSPGSVIEVKLKNRPTYAFVLGFPENAEIERDKLKPIEAVLVAEPLFDEVMLRFLRWVSDYYCHPLGEVLAAAVPQQCWKPRASTRKRRSKAPADPVVAEPTPRPELSAEQAEALRLILDPEEKRPVLLFGVTGSGKTEVYMRALEQVVESGKGAIVLVPEIALTPQLVGRFSSRFPGQVAVLHSDLTAGERFDQWERLRKGERRIVVGARSAVFAPVRDLGLVVVDEEHEGSFKQEDSLRYHARDLAIARARFFGARVILGSATPSVESFSHAQSGKYACARLKNRIHSRSLPRTTFVDLRDRAQWQSPRLPWISRELVGRIERTLRDGQQAMIFLNRLGFAHFLFCTECGHTWRCRNCDVALTYYQNPPILKCHYCSSSWPVPKSCELCQGVALETMGVGTEQAEKEFRTLFPNARIGRFDRGAIKTRQDLEAILGSISRREIDIVIGTQMIAKGHDFPGIALVGVLVADASLNLPDFRANERTFQIITQVSGRAGRAEVPGQVVIQTINPEHPVLGWAAGNQPEEFYRTEMQTRQRFGFPPFQRTAMLRFQHRNATAVEHFAVEIARFVKTRTRCQAIGPSAAPLARLNNQYRWQCLVKSESVSGLQSCLLTLREYAAYLKSPVQFAIDVDPVNAM